MIGVFVRLYYLYHITVFSIQCYYSTTFKRELLYFLLNYIHFDS